MLLRDCSQLALTRPFKREVCQMIEHPDIEGTIEIGNNTSAKTPVDLTRPHDGNLSRKSGHKTT